MSEHIEGSFNLGCQAIPQLQWEVTVHCRKGGKECSLKSLDYSLRCIDPVIVRFDDLQLAIIFGEKIFDMFCSLIVHDI